MKHKLRLALPFCLLLLPAPAGAQGADGFKVQEVKEGALKSLREASAAGGRALLINFWATWCAPCRDEFPDLVRVRALYPPARLDFVTVSLDDPSDISSAVPDFLAEMRAGRIPAYLLNATDEDAAVALVDPAWRKELPATFLYDRAGALSFKHMGRIKPAELTAAIEKTRGAK